MVKNKLEISNMDFEISFYEGILEKSPNFIEVLGAIGDLYTKRGLFEEGLRVDERLVQLRPDDEIVLYNLACSYSLMNRVNEALRTIKKAINCGYEDFEHMESDDDLLNLKKDSRFIRYFSRIKKRVKS